MCLFFRWTLSALFLSPFFLLSSLPLSFFLREGVRERGSKRVTSAVCKPRVEAELLDTARDLPVTAVPSPADHTLELCSRAHLLGQDQGWGRQEGSGGQTGMPSSSILLSCGCQSSQCSAEAAASLLPSWIAISELAAQLEETGVTDTIIFFNL